MMPFHQKEEAETFNYDGSNTRGMMSCGSAPTGLYCAAYEQQLMWITASSALIFAARMECQVCECVSAAEYGACWKWRI